MDERQLENILYLLEDRKIVFLQYLDMIEGYLQDDTFPQNERSYITEERDTILYELREIELDIGAYTEMKNRLYFSEIGACGVPCDGQCPQCGGTESYNPLYEVFTGGDY
jgi:hypothetical protein